MKRDYGEIKSKKKLEKNELISQTVSSLQNFLQTDININNFDPENQKCVMKELKLINLKEFAKCNTLRPFLKLLKLIYRYLQFHSNIKVTSKLMKLISQEEVNLIFNMTSKIDHNKSIMPVKGKHQLNSIMSRTHTRKMYSSLDNYDKYKNCPAGYLYLSSKIKLNRIK